MERGQLCHGGQYTRYTRVYEDVGNEKNAPHNGGGRGRLGFWGKFSYRRMVCAPHGQYDHRRMGVWRWSIARDGGAYTSARVWCRLRDTFVLSELSGLCPGARLRLHTVRL